MTVKCIEFYVYKVTDPARAARARESAMKAIGTYDGFRSWRGLASIEEPNLFIDYVEWQDADAARAAQKTFCADPRTRDFMAAIESMVAMSHCEQTAALAA